MRSLAFSKRVTKEMLRDPLSYIFCLGFPIFMLLLFACINASLPTEARQVTFTPPVITPGIGMFGQTFVMLFTSLLVSRDRETCLLQRLYVSPMTAKDFIFGYAGPMLVLALAQAVICFLAGGVLGGLQGDPLPLWGSILSIISLIPSAVLFVSLGLLLGSVMNDKGAPAVTSILITASSILGGIWMPLEQMKGFRSVCEYLPFYHCVEAARAAMQGRSAWGHELVVAAFAVVVAVLAVLAFRRNMKR